MIFLASVILGQTVLLVSAQIDEDDENKVTIPYGAYSPLCERKRECYVPEFLIIEQGDKVEWQNMDYSIHTVTSGNLWSGHDKLFNSKILEKDDRFEFIFDNVEPATYTYYCLMHPWMIGSIIVSGQNDIAPKAFS